MKTSEQINEIAAALSKAQSIMTGARKSNANLFFKSKYSDLASVMQAISLPFSENGLAFVQAAEFAEGMICVTTRIMHSSGQWVEAATQVPTVKNDPQAYGSAVTYAKRYGLQALAGVPSVDDDGNYCSAMMQEENLKRMKAKPVLTPESKQWESAIAAYKRDGNLDSVLARADVSPEHILLIVEAANVA